MVKIRLATTLLALVVSWPALGARAESRDVMAYQPGALISTNPGGFGNGRQMLDGSEATFWQPNSLQGELTRYFEVPHSIQRIEIEASDLNAVSVSAATEFGESFSVVADHQPVGSTPAVIELKGIRAHAIRLHFFGKGWPVIREVRALTSDSIEEQAAARREKRKSVPALATIHGDLESFGWLRSAFGWDQWNVLNKRLDNGDFDLLLAGPLPADPNVRQQTLKSLRSFAESGGVAFFFDVQKPEQADWLAEIDPRWRIRASLAGIGEKTGVPVHIEAPQSAFMSQPYRVQAWGAPYGHLMVNSEGWEELATDPEGYGALIMRRIGKGAFVLSSNDSDQVPLRELLTNLGAWQRTQRSGIAVKSLEWPQFRYGSNTVKVELANQSDEAASLSVLVGDSGGPGSTSKVTLKVGETKKLEVPVSLTRPGMGRLTLQVVRAGQPEAIQQFTSKNYVLPEPLSLTLLNARYSNSVYSTDPDQSVRVAARLTPVKKGELLSVKLLDQNGVSVQNPRLAPSKQAGLSEYSFDVTALAPGTYRVRAFLTGQNNHEIAQAEVAFTKVAPSSREVILDSHGRTLINGKPFFPLGLYRVPKEQLREYASHGFNTVVVSENLDRSFLDAAEAAKLKVLPITWGDLKVCEEFKDHPAILAWYLSDEPGGRATEHPSHQIGQYQAYKKIDPYHPVIIVDNSFGGHVEACDILAPDIYPFTWSDKHKTNNSIWETAYKYDALNNNPALADHSLWRVPGVFTQSTSVYLRTSKRQMWADAYGSICLGSQGFLWYSYWSPEDPEWNMDKSAMKPWLSDLTGELSGFSEVLLSVEKTPSITIKPEQARLLWTTRTQGNNDYLIAVNWHSNPMMKAVTFADKRTTTAVDERTGQKIAVKDGQMLLNLDPLQVAVLRFPKPSSKATK